MSLEEIGFSDHAPMPKDGFDNWRMLDRDLEGYVRMVEVARQEHPDLVIRLALEIDYLPGYEDWIRDLARRHPWDYLIGSVHYVSDSWAVDDPAQQSNWAAESSDAIWRAYADRLQQAADLGIFQIMGHIDLPKKFGHSPPKEVNAFYAPFLETAARQGVAIELNTAGLRKECREIYPSPGLLTAAHEAGVRITFGSDAHDPAEVGFRFEEAMALARQAGYSSYCRFEKGARQTVPF